MKCYELVKHIEKWAPKGVAWQKDNVGLQVGSLNNELKKIVLALELTTKVLDEAILNDANFIFTHHPFIFTPIKRLNFDDDDNSVLIQKLIKHDITLYSAHTNLDFVNNGVSFSLANQLGLTNIKFLSNLKSTKKKIVVFVPKNNFDEVSEALYSSGAGIIGNYSKCSFSLEGKGTFLGDEKTNPSVGTKEKFESVEEIRLEVIVDEWNLGKAISEMIKAHPYEEPAFDVYSIENENTNFGIGTIGDLPHKMKQDEFFIYLKEKLNLKNFRYCDGKSELISRVALCGGSGSELLSTAMNKEADVFVTGDIKYHAFHEAWNKIILIDAGHFETEIFVLDEMKKFIENILTTNKSESKICIVEKRTNPVKFFKK